MYIVPSITNLMISENILILPLNQLLRKIPPKIVPRPIQMRVIAPLTKPPTTALFVMISEMLAPFGIAPSGMSEIPLDIPTRIIMIPANVENILINVDGVVLLRELRDLSISNALITNATPSTLKTIAKASLVNPKMVANPLEISRAPGTPKKNFEYLGSYTNILTYFPKTAYEYSTLLLCRIMIL